MSRAATGTDEHSQPGNNAPHVAATGTDNGELPNTLATQVGGTNAAIAPLSATPNTKNGNAWVVVAKNIVNAFCHATDEDPRPSNDRTTTSPHSSTAAITNDLIEIRR